MTVTLEWQHPHRGRIREPLCDAHDNDVLRALKVLGIGCTGRSGDTRPCSRCAHDGVRAFRWLDEYVVTEPDPAGRAWPCPFCHRQCATQTELMGHSCTATFQAPNSAGDQTPPEVAEILAQAAADDEECTSCGGDGVILRDGYIGSGGPLEEPCDACTPRGRPEP